MNQIDLTTAPDIETARKMDRRFARRSILRKGNDESRVTGAAVVRAMRHYGVTIPQLAKIAGLTQIRIRKARETGLPVSAMIDWRQCMEAGKLTNDALTGRLRDRFYHWKENRR